MRSFQPIARRMDAGRNRIRWTPPRVVRIVARCIIAGCIMLMLSYAWQFESWLQKVQRDPSGQTILAEPKPLIPIMAAGPLMLLLIPLAANRQIKPKRKHVPDPALSILPR